MPDDVPPDGAELPVPKLEPNADEDPAWREEEREPDEVLPLVPEPAREEEAASEDDPCADDAENDDPLETMDPDEDPVSVPSVVPAVQPVTSKPAATRSRCEKRIAMQ